jgi:hypothetical protein
MAFTQKTRQEYVYASASDQPQYLSAGLKHSDMAFAHLLFCYCVSEFKAIPSKKKALYIWDTFLEGINAELDLETQDIDKLELSIETCGDDTAHCLVRMEIDDARYMRNQALAMNRVKRFFTSAERIPPTTLFDNWVKAMLARQGNSPWIDIVSYVHQEKINAPSIYAKKVGQIPAVKQKLIDAGFIKVAAALKAGIG